MVSVKEEDALPTSMVSMRPARGSLPDKIRAASAGAGAAGSASTPPTAAGPRRPAAGAAPGAASSTSPMSLATPVMQLSVASPTSPAYGGSATPSSLHSRVVSLDCEKMKEADLAAERVWWAENSERQMKELEALFGMRFKQSTDQFRSDMAAHQDRLEMLVESEKRQRHAALAELRRDLDTFQVALQEVKRGQLEAKAEHEQQKAQLLVCEAATTNLHGEIARSLEAEAMRRPPQELEELRRGQIALEERAQQQRSNVEEVRQTALQSVAEVRGSVKEVSNALAIAERALREELAATKGRVDSAIRMDSSELREELVREVLSRVDRRSPGTADVRSELSDVSQRLRGVDAAVREGQRLQLEAKASHDLHKAQLSACEAVVTSLQRDFTRIRAEADSARGATGAELLRRQEPCAELRDLQRDVSRLEGRAQQQQESIEQVHQSVGDLTRSATEVSDALGAEVRALREELAGAEGRLDAALRPGGEEALGQELVRGRDGAAAVAAGDVRSELSDVNQRLQALDAAIHEARQVQLEAKEERQQQRAQLLACEAAVANLRGDVARVAQQQPWEELRQEDLERRLAGLEGRAQRQQDSVEQVHQSVEQVRRAALQSSEELARGLREVSAALSAAEAALRQELASTNARMDVALQMECRDLREALVREVVRGQDGNGAGTVDVQSELSDVNQRLQALDDACKRASAAAAMASAAAGLPLQVQVQGSSEVRSLEDAALCARLNAVEAEVRYAARKPEVRRLEELVEQASQRLEPRLAAVEAELQCSSRARAEARSHDAARRAPAAAPPPPEPNKAFDGPLAGVDLVGGFREEPVAVNVKSLMYEADLENTPATTAPTSTEDHSQDVLSADLKHSISSLIQRVQRTLSQPTAAGENDFGLPRAPEESSPILHRGLDGAPTPVSLSALRDLQSRNLSLREENAELVEELLVGSHASLPMQPRSPLGML